MREEARVGVFVCDCGSNIAGVVDIPEVVSYVRTLGNVVLADEGKWSCSVDYLSKLKNAIKEHSLNRVVIASCTPRTHEPLFKRACKDAGLNPYLLEFVSIREQVSWVHMHQPEAATQKAKELIKMGVAKSILLEEGHEIKLPVKTDCLVIGGGMTGMHAALQVAMQGFRAVLVERSDRLGGLLNQICFLSHGDQRVPAQQLVASQAARVEANTNITVYTGAEITDLSGYIGHYSVTVRANGQITQLPISTVIVATGMRESLPDGRFGYGDDPRVVTQLQLESRLREKSLANVKKVVMINCVGSKNQTRGCCNLGCHVSVKNALALKTRFDDICVHILYRDLSMVKEEGEAIAKAKQKGVKFIRFPDDRYPEVSLDGGQIGVRTHDYLVGRDFELEADLLVLTSAFIGDESVDQLRGLLKVSANRDGFFQESHVKLAPLQFPADGIGLGGCAKAPMFCKESCEEGIGAAMRVSIPMKKGYIEAEGIVAELDPGDCSQCGLCAKKCPYQAISLDAQKNPTIIKALCKGCGLCAADCPKECISIVHYTDPQIFAQVEAALEESPERKVIAFVCHWCALGGVDMAGVSRLQYPPHARLIRVMCSARVSIKMIQKAFELGAAGVLVAGCEFPTCHYIKGNYEAEKRLKRARRKLSKAGFDPKKLYSTWCSAADGPKFAGVMRSMMQELGLG